MCSYDWNCKFRKVLYVLGDLMVGTSTRVCVTILRTFMLVLGTVAQYEGLSWWVILHYMGVPHGCGYCGTIRGTFIVGTMVL